MKSYLEMLKFEKYEPMPDPPPICKPIHDQMMKCHYPPKYVLMGVNQFKVINDFMEKFNDWQEENGTLQYMSKSCEGLPSCTYIYNLRVLEVKKDDFLEVV